MRVLVTGAATALGSEIALALLDRADVELVLATDAAPEARDLPRGEPRLLYVCADLAHARSAHDLLFGQARDHQISAVVHGPLDDGPCTRGRHRARNIDATRELLSLCERHPTIRQLVYRSTSDVYALRAGTPNLIEEDHPLEFDPAAPPWIRDRVEADLHVCTRLGRSPLRVAVLRSAEVLAPGTGSQLWDYLGSRVCLRPLGFDPMINLLSAGDYVSAVIAALGRRAHGVYNIPGADTLPLSRVVRRFGRHEVAVPGPLLAPLYRLRARTTGFEFSYDRNMRRFHFGGVLDGSRARDDLGYLPRDPLPELTRRSTAAERGPVNAT